MVDVAYARRHWPDAELLADDHLSELLGVSLEQCQAYAPSDASFTEHRCMLAVVYQARELANAATATGGDVLVSNENGQIYARDLTATVKSLLRPPTRVPVVG